MFRARWRPRRGERLWCARCGGAAGRLVGGAGRAAQLVALNATLSALGVTVRVDKLRMVSQLFGRELASTSEGGYPQ
jgi:hypothetical protein